MDKDNASVVHEKQLDAALESVRTEMTALHEGLRAKVSVGVNEFEDGCVIVRR